MCFLLAQINIFLYSQVIVLCTKYSLAKKQTARSGWLADQPWKMASVSSYWRRTVLCCTWELLFHLILFLLGSVFTGTCFLLCSWLLILHLNAMICSLNSWQSGQMQWAPYKCTGTIVHQWRLQSRPLLFWWVKFHPVGATLLVFTTMLWTDLSYSTHSLIWCYSSQIHWIATEHCNISVLHILPISPGCR